MTTTNIKAGRDLARAQIGQRLCFSVDLLTWGLPLTRAQTVVLSEVVFLPPSGEQPATVGGALVQVGGVGVKDGVVLRPRSGALAVRQGGTWHLGWDVVGWHPASKGWYRIDSKGRMLPLHLTAFAVGVGRHLFAPTLRQREYPPTR